MSDQLQTIQSVTAAEVPLDGNAAPSDEIVQGLQDRSKGYKRRILHLVEEMFGPSPRAQIDGLIKTRKGGQIVVNTASDGELKAAYARGRADLQAEIEFAERLAAAKAKYPDFDAALNAVRPLIPRSVLEEAWDHPVGLESAYRLSKLPELCQELSEMDPEKARERFRFFIRDLAALKGTQ